MNTSVNTPAGTSGALPTTDPALEDALRAGLDLVEAKLRAAVANADPIADAPSRHLVEAGGKRVRPMLTLLGAHLANPGARVPEEVVDAAVVCELTHLASLYHDDVMDSAPTRRGAPAAQHLYGNNVAILTGDLLFARASNVVSALGPVAVKVQAETFERLCLGQLHETVGPRPGEDAVVHYLDVLSDKTASLIATAGRFGAVFAGGSDDVVQAMIRYGEDVGVAFQLADDVLDLTSDVGESGKRPGTDLREGVPTLPVLLARRAGAEGDAAAQRVVELLDSGRLGDDAVLAEAVAALRRHPVTDQARRTAREWAHRASTHLAALPPSPAREALETYAATIADRVV
ncbi:polyprenyl synthetase family protein [Kineococcus rhizosphaerae]|uniref:Heptaprenyl diphosphate synthase n=1 Tax=Kineococcus rhizosphaerae TaxID=559628 RepID=A0A2T0R588_9ACTN|nr:polyprenyl synthetase family protein [Kineococcus rhizosphaerae]PRY15933.1 heptaprenyl diphosphate synthase [Kineococcus rhizosphaerae]